MFGFALAEEMEAYGLRASMEVASLNASLARKHRFLTIAR